MVIGVNRKSIQVTTYDRTRLFQTLLVPVVTGFAQGLMVLRVPEQLVVTPMRFNVIDHHRRDHAPLLQVHHTQGMLTQVALPILLPPPVIASLGGRLSVLGSSHGPGKEKATGVPWLYSFRLTPLSTPLSL
jgi:hypothetical protein